LSDLKYAAYVLRVLSKQTLETSKEVKDPSVPGPSLVKEVKDSSLTILHHISITIFTKVETRCKCRRFLQGGALHQGDLLDLRRKSEI